MTAIALPPGLTHIGVGAFQSCLGITEIALPPGLTLRRILNSVRVVVVLCQRRLIVYYVVFGWGRRGGDVCPHNGAFTGKMAAALALLDSAVPAQAALAAAVLRNATRDIRLSEMTQYAPDGAWSEGPT